MVEAGVATSLVPRLEELGLRVERESARQLAGGLAAGLAMAATHTGFGWTAFARTIISGAAYALVALLVGRLWAAWGLHVGWNLGLFLLGVPVSGTTSGTATRLGRSAVLGDTAYGPEATPAALALWCLAFAVALGLLVHRWPRAAGQAG